MHQVMTKYALTYVGQWDLWELVSSLSACFSPLIRPFRFHLEVINHFTKASTSRNCSTKSKFWVLQQQMVGRQSFTSTFNIINNKKNELIHALTLMIVNFNGYNCYWKRIFSMNPYVRMLVGWSGSGRLACHYFLENFIPLVTLACCSYRSACHY